MTLKMPAEWAPHDAVWIGFPHLAEEWAGAIDEGRRDVAAFANAVHDGGRGEEVRLVVNDARQADIAAALVDPGVKILVQPLGDIWLRDTGPIIAGTGAARRARNFRFNWWGEKFVMPGDQEIGAALALTSGLPVDDPDWVLEGGGIDVEAERLVQPHRDILARQRRIAVEIEQAFLGGNAKPRAVDVDAAAFQHPVLIVDRQAAFDGERGADFLVARHDELLAPPVEPEIARTPRRARSGYDRPRIAQPDVAQGLDKDFHARIDERGGDLRLPRIVDHQPHLFAAATVVDGVGESSDVAPPFIDRA